MAIYPCDAHKARYAGPQRTIYPALIDGSFSRRERRRLCPDCFLECSEWIATHLLAISDDDTGARSCVACGATDTRFAIFATVYDQKEERMDFYGRCCATCGAGPVSMALFGATTQI